MTVYTIKKTKISAATITPVNNGKNNAGFTLIELLVVLSIMGLMLTMVTLNLNGLTAGRNLKIAQNQLVTNIRQLQSFSLASRNAPNGQPADYYVIKLDPTTPNKYTLQAIYNALSTPKVVDVQTVELPNGIIFLPVNAGASQYPVIIKRPSFSTQYIDPGSASLPHCAIVAFKLPFARVLTNNGCSLPSSPTVRTSPPDDYSKLLTFRVNMEQDTSGTGSTAGSDSSVVISLVDAKRTLAPKMVMIQGLTGLICTTSDGTNCQVLN